MLRSAKYWETDMDWDEPRSRPVTHAIGESLATLSIGELETRVSALQVEIERVMQEIARKRAHEAAASAIFKS
jgi:uncharacterized small protein (DUF1192 family)